MSAHDGERSTSADPANRVEHIMGRVLFWGVLLAAAISVAGAISYLLGHHGQPMDLSVFHGQPKAFTQPSHILDALRGPTPGRGVIQLGLLTLVALQLLRMLITVGLFARVRDWLYVGFTLFILGVLIAGFLS